MRDAKLDGLNETAYHLNDVRLHEAVTESWTRLGRTWAGFQAGLTPVASTDPATTLTRERWLLPLFAELGYGRLSGARPVEREGRSYPISHAWQGLPIHLVGWNVDLDTRTAGVAGAARMSPHGLVQEVLNRSRDHLWGLVTNGQRLRLLRDSASLTRQAYVEFDLEAMFRGEAYSDFAVLWLLLHQSRVEQERAADWWLERWAQEAHRQGVAVRDRLRDQVQQAIETLGRGFVAHPANETLREALRSGRLDGLGYYRQLLRLVYRLLFLFVAEDRGLLLDPAADRPSHDRYVRFYSTTRLRDLAGRYRGTGHSDQWRSLALVAQKLGDNSGCPELGLPALGSFLWSSAATAELHACELSNRDLLAAIRALAWTEEDRVRRPVDYQSLGPEELGSVYEALLELHPEINTDAATFTLTTASGHERKTTGSYYTPSSLIQALLDSALDPVLDRAARGPDPDTAILSLKVCDPACGSGHFLIAAAHRIARRLAAGRTGEEEPSPEAVRHALRDVIGRCIYGIDINEMAVELCKVALWMEALEPGKPLSFLDHRIVCGNSLLGATPALIANGIPDDAFETIEGDEKPVVVALRKRNHQERQGQMQLSMVAEPGTAYEYLGSGFASLAAAGDDSIAALQDKADRFDGLVGSPAYQRAKLLADAWCAAFIWRKAKRAPEAITEDNYRRIEAHPETVAHPTRSQIDTLAGSYRFLHWHLAFPDVFRLPRQHEATENPAAGWNGGFDVVLGNPPWERVKLQEKEWFTSMRPDIAAAPNAAARGKLIQLLKTEDPPLHAAWLDALRQSEGESHLARHSGRYPLCGRGDINTYALFAETNRLIVRKTGRVGCIVPTGIATDATTQLFFKELVDTRSLVSLYGFENEGKLFVGVDHRVNFCLLIFGTKNTETIPHFAAFLRHPDVLEDAGRRYPLSAEDIALLNPNTHTCPVFRTRRDAELTKDIYRRVPVLLREGPPDDNPWEITFIRMFDMANDSALFRTRQQLELKGWELRGNVFLRQNDTFLPLYEAKMVSHFTHRFGDFNLVEPGDRAHILPTPGHDLLVRDDYVPLPRYWVAAEEVRSRVPDWWRSEWFMGWRDVTDPRSSIRTVLSSVIPPTAVSGKFPLLLPRQQPSWFVFATLSSFALDYVARQKLGGVSLSMFIMRQLPLLPPSVAASPCTWSRSRETVADFVRPRMLELIYTSVDLEPFARDCGYKGPPFRWNDARRFFLRCELDAAFFLLYGLARDDVAYIMDTFPIVQRDDEKRHGEYRTKRVILEIYDAIAKAITTGKPYETLLDPPPADPRTAHAERT